MIFKLCYKFPSLLSNKTLPNQNRFVLVNVIFIFRFIQLPLILSDRRPEPGPASRTLYSLPAHLVSLYPEAGHPAELRAELSLAYSRVYFLQPHAIARSFLEELPLSSYSDPEAHRSAALLYTLPQTPSSDLLRTQTEINGIWRQFYRDQSLRIRQLRTLSDSGQN